MFVTHTLLSLFVWLPLVWCSEPDLDLIRHNGRLAIVGRARPQIGAADTVGGRRPQRRAAVVGVLADGHWRTVWIGAVRLDVRSGRSQDDAVSAGVSIDCE